MIRRIPRPSFVVAVVLPLTLAACGGSQQADGSSPTPAPAPASAPAPTPTGASTSTLSGGAYTLEQATRGKIVFDETCSECHALGELRGDDFMFNWEGSSVGRLYRVISTTMPDDDPGALPEDAYLSVIAYILELNEFPAGSTALVADMDALNQLRIER